VPSRRLLARDCVSIRSRRRGREKRPKTPEKERSEKFQSAPDAEAGRNSWPAVRSSPTSSFNPLPTQRPGETVDFHDRMRVWQQFQSAPDAEAGRNVKGSTYENRPHLFQSAPDAEAGRNRSASASTARIWSFQSAPDAEAGRNKVGQLERKLRKMFQSAPDAEAGRNAGIPAFGFAYNGFNPLPTQRPGETPSEQPSNVVPLVSIRSRRRGREKPAYAAAGTGPLPVSIRSRRRGREKRSAARAPTAGARGFNPLPTQRPGETVEDREQRHSILLFQSAPDAEAGRNARRGAGR